jgi:hypothetical protein
MPAMPFDAKVPDIDTLVGVDDFEFVRVVCSAMGRYDMRAPGFNLAANAKMITPIDSTNRAIFLYPEESQELIAAGFKALREFDSTGKVSLGTREEFLLAETRDLLRGVDGDKTSDEYKQLYERVMGYVSGRLTSISSLALATPSEYESSPLPPPKPSPGPKL